MRKIIIGNRKATKKTIDPKKLEDIRGFEFKPTVNIKDLINHYHHLGFQASHIAQGVELIREMTDDKAEIYISATSNMGSSGIRELIAQLIRDKKISGLVTTTGLVEEDVMKSFFSFKLGEFDADDEEIKANKINRIGNIFVPDEYYAKLESWHSDLLEKLYKEKKVWTPNEYIAEMGKKLKDEHSILYWAAKRNIPVIAPGIIDGALGLHWMMFNQSRQPEERFVLDQIGDMNMLSQNILNANKLGGIFLGGGISKHHLLGAALLRDGLDYGLYVNTGTQYDGSLSGAHPKEATSWNKLKDKKNSVHIEAEATIAFPLLMTGFY
jgi:deoxyhypusine synthase